MTERVWIQENTSFAVLKLNSHIELMLTVSAIMSKNIIKC